MSKKVLVVDDEADFCRLMVLHLKRRGFDAVGTDDPQEAVKIIKEAGPGGFGVVVTDWMMPRMSGSELILSIVDIDPEIIPIAITAVEQMGQLAVRGFGAIEYLVKPLDNMAQLSAAVKRAMDLGKDQAA
jgi:DNA-binding NtrC family response regulator